jgi:hypothetical protein
MFNTAKKIICLCLIFIIMISLTACLTPEQRSDAKMKAQAAELELEKFLESKYDKFKIKNSEQLILGNFLSGLTVSSITTFDVKVNGTWYKFAYDAQSDSVLCDINYADVLSELNKKLDEHDLLQKANYKDVAINVLGTDLNLLWYEDVSLDHVLKRAKEPSNTYQFVAKYRYIEKKNLDPENEHLDLIYDDIYPLSLTIVNNSADFDGINEDATMIDKVICDDHFAYADRDHVITIDHTHQRLMKLDHITFAYDDARYYLNVAGSDYFQQNPARIHDDGKYYIFTCRAYDLKFGKIQNADFTRQKQYINESGSTVKITNTSGEYLKLYFDKDHLPGEYIYQTSKAEMSPVSTLSINKTLILLSDDDYQKETIAFYVQREEADTK